MIPNRTKPKAEMEKEGETGQASIALLCRASQWIIAELKEKFLKNWKTPGYLKKLLSDPQLHSHFSQIPISYSIIPKMNSFQNREFFKFIKNTYRIHWAFKNRL